MVKVGSEENAVKLTSVLGTLPSRRKTFMGLLAMGFLFGVLTHLVLPVEQTDAYYFILGIIERGTNGFFLISLPAILSAFTFTLIKRVALRKSLFIAFVCSLVYVLFYYITLASQGNGVTADVMFVGYGLAFVVWYLVARVFFNLHWYTSFVLSVTQLVYNASFLLIGKLVFVSTDPAATVIKIYFSALAFLAALYAVFWLIDAPMRRNFGVSGIKAISLFMAQWMSKSKDLEGMFESVGEEIETIVNVMMFKRKNKNCLFVTPYVHYGPFGNLGGSEFPYLIAKSLEKETGSDVFVFHGTATHDFNPVSSDEIIPILEGCRKALSNMKIGKGVGKIVTGKAGTCKANCIMVNDSCFVGLTRAPRTTEDVDFALGMSIRYMGISMGMKEVGVIDAHNAETGEITRVHMGDPVGFEYMDSVKHALEHDGAQNSMKIGIHIDDMAGVSEGSIGMGGLKTAVFQVKKKLFATILFDANGILPGFRREIINAIRETGFTDCEVYTTDTHSVNTVSGVLNPLGGKESEEVVERVVQSVMSAKKDLSEFQAGMRTERIKIKVFGTQQSSELLGTVNSIVAVTRLAIPTLFFLTALFVLWGITKL